MSRGWIGVDLDATLAHYTHWVSWNSIGPPVEKMVERVKQWLAEGKDVRIFTARANIGSEGFECKITGQFVTQRMMLDVIQDYSEKLFGVRLPVTYQKDFMMIELWDDRAVQVIPNTGERADGR
jgi:hypothetical protein